MGTKVYKMVILGILTEAVYVMQEYRACETLQCFVNINFDFVRKLQVILNRQHHNKVLK